MAKPNYQYDKRQRELKKAKQQEEKRQKKLARNAPAEESTPDSPDQESEEQS
jgi:hypothetical protein